MVRKPVFTLQIYQCLMCFLLYLKGSDINATDKAERSPLLLATQKGGWRTVHLLLENGANFMMTDSDNRNLLHYAVLFGGSLESLGRSFFKVVSIDIFY